MWGVGSVGVGSKGNRAALATSLPEVHCDLPMVEDVISHRALWLINIFDTDPSLWRALFLHC